MGKWQPMRTVPKDGTWVLFVLRNGALFAARYYRHTLDDDGKWMCHDGGLIYVEVGRAVAWQPTPAVRFGAHVDGHERACARYAALYSEMLDQLEGQLSWVNLPAECRENLSDLVARAEHLARHLPPEESIPC